MASRVPPSPVFPPSFWLASKRNCLLETPIRASAHLPVVDSGVFAPSYSEVDELRCCRSQLPIFAISRKPGPLVDEEVSQDDARVEENGTCSSCSQSYQGYVMTSRRRVIMGIKSAISEGVNIWQRKPERRIGLDAGLERTLSARLPFKIKSY